MVDRLVADIYSYPKCEEMSLKGDVALWYIKINILLKCNNVWEANVSGLFSHEDKYLIT